MVRITPYQCGYLCGVSPQYRHAELFVGIARTNNSMVETTALKNGDSRLTSQVIVRQTGPHSIAVRFTLCTTGDILEQPCSQYPGSRLGRLEVGQCLSGLPWSNWSSVLLPFWGKAVSLQSSVRLTIQVADVRSRVNANFPLYTFLDRVSAMSLSVPSKCSSWISYSACSSNHLARRVGGSVRILVH